MERVRPVCYENNIAKLPYFTGYSENYINKECNVCNRCKGPVEFFLGMHLYSSEQRRVLDFDCFWKEMEFGTNAISIDLIYGIDQLKYEDQKLILEKLKWYSELQMTISKPPALEIFAVDSSIKNTKSLQKTWNPLLLMTIIKIEPIIKCVDCYICNRFIKIGYLAVVDGSQTAHLSCAFHIARFIWGTIDMLMGYDNLTEEEKSLLQSEYNKKMKSIVAAGKQEPSYITLFGHSIREPILILSTINFVESFGSTTPINAVCPTCEKKFAEHDIAFFFNNQVEHSSCAFKRAIMIFDTPEEMPSWNKLTEIQQWHIRIEYMAAAKLAPMKTMVFLNPARCSLKKHPKNVSEPMDFIENDENEEMLKNQLTQMGKLRKLLNAMGLYDLNQVLKCNNLKEQMNKRMALEQSLDMIMFGAPVPCALCKGSVIYNISERCYTCTGHFSRFTSCIFSSKQVERTECALPNSAKFKEVKQLVAEFSILPTRLYAGNDHKQLKSSLPQLPYEFNMFSENTGDPHSFNLLLKPFQKRQFLIKQGSAVSTNYPKSKEVHVSRDVGSGKKYEAVFTMVDVQKNQNTIKHLVILEDDCEDIFDVVITTSRAGTSLEGYEKKAFQKRREAIDHFENCFNKLTGSLWERRNYCVKKHGKFNYLEVLAPELDNAFKTNRGKTELKVMKTVAPKHYESLLVQFSTESAIVGRVSEKMQDLAMTSLQQLMELVENRTAKRQEIIDLTNTIYTYFPVCTGFEVVLLDTMDKIENVMERLYDVKLIEYVPLVHPCDSLVQSLQAELKTLTNPFELITIDSYHQNTQGTTHHANTVLKDIFAINRFGHPNHTFPGPRMLLWHGTSKENLSNILSKGLLIRPNGVSSGSMFGAGIYFADCFSKSFNYAAGIHAVKYLLLCEVYLGKQHETFKSMDQTEVEGGLETDKFDSVKGMGRYRPNNMCSRDLDGVVVPCGKLEDVFEHSTTTNAEKSKMRLLYNEYIVYDPKRVKLRYLVVVQTENQKK